MKNISINMKTIKQQRNQIINNYQITENNNNNKINNTLFKNFEAINLKRNQFNM